MRRRTSTCRGIMMRLSTSTRNLSKWIPTFQLPTKVSQRFMRKKGMNDEAILEIEKAIELSAKSVFILDDLGYIYARAGRKEDAMKVLEDLDRTSADEYVPAYGRVVIHAALGDKEKALAWLEKAYEERSFLVYLKVDPAFDALREEERFVKILEKMGL